MVGRPRPAHHPRHPCPKEDPMSHDGRHPAPSSPLSGRSSTSTTRTSASSRSTSTPRRTSRATCRAPSAGTGRASCPTGSAATSRAARTSRALLSESGIGPDTHIVLYGDNNNWFAAWAYWQLKLHGVEHVSILNGGRKYWLDNGLPVTVDVPSYPATGLSPAGAGLRASRVPRRHPAAPRRCRARRWWTCARPPSSTARSSRLQA